MSSIFNGQGHLGRHGWTCKILDERSTNINFNCHMSANWSLKLRYQRSHLESSTTSLRSTDYCRRRAQEIGVWAFSHRYKWRRRRRLRGTEEIYWFKDDFLHQPEQYALILAFFPIGRIIAPYERLYFVSKDVTQLTCSFRGGEIDFDKPLPPK